VILLDSSGLFTGLVPDQPEHARVRSVLAHEQPPIVLSPFVLAEVDYFLARQGGQIPELRLLDEVASGAYELPVFESSDVHRVAEVIRRYDDLNIGLADASIVVLAGRYGTSRVLTFDERHFRALRTPVGDAFVVLPADA
jgi:uncharacterized protein